MANQKMNIGKITEKDVPSFTKGTTSAKETITGNLGKDNVVGSIRSVATERFEKVALEPAVDFINSSKLNRKTFVNCVVKPSVMSWRFTDGIIGLSRNDIIDGLRNLGERLRGVEARDRANANLVVRGFKSFVERFFDVGGGGYTPGDFKAEVNPDGGIDVSYAGVAGVFVSSTRPIAVSLSYTLKRKEKKGSTWVNITSGECRSGFSITDMGEGVPLKLNTEYTYHLSIKILNAAEIKASKDTYELERDVLYKALDVKIVDFTAEPDPIERRVNLKFDVKNYTEIRVVREDTKKELENIYRDSDVTAGGTYRYVLYASNAWYKDEPKKAVADCTNVLPTAGKLTYRMETTVRGVVLFMETIKNGFVTAIERQQLGSSEWKTFSPITNQQNYKDYDDSLYPGKTLKVGETYNYRAKYSNNWGEDSFAYSKTISVKMVNETYLPPMPRMLPPKYAGETIRWTTSDKAKSYEVKRYDNSNEKDFYKIDSGTGDVECDRRWPEKKDEIKVFSSISDNQIQKDVQYLYKITARNAWGEAVSYQDVMIPESEKGKIDDKCYKFLGWREIYQDPLAQQGNLIDWIINFQGITTDGEWWYFTNGHPEHTIVNPPSLRKTAVDRSLGRVISRDYKLPGDAHVGDLDCYGDYLFVAVYKESEGDRAEIWIFDKNLEERKRITTIVLYKKDGNPLKGIAWCAINPFDKRLYTSETDTDGYIHLYSFKVNFEYIENPNMGNYIIPKDSVYEVPLYDEYGKPFKKEKMQGGCFDYYNNLYLNSGINDHRDSDGIHVFKLICDEEAAIRNVLSNAANDEDRAKKYEAYKSNDSDLPCVCNKGVLLAKSEQEDKMFLYKFDVTKGQEPEGLTYCDFNYSIRKPQSISQYGSFRAGLLLNNDEWTQLYADSLRFGIFSHIYRETVEKHVSFSGLSVVLDSATNGAKIVDKGILVKRFKTLETANEALAVLKNFKKDNRIGNVIYTVGWLCTSDSNHNYEFSVLKWDGKDSLANQANFVIEYNSKNLKMFGNKKGDPSERYIVRLMDKNGAWYHFLAHNKEDADKILGILNGYKKICIIGVGPDSEERNYFSSENFGHRIRSEYNLIWLEK